jgi:hypothetical protein
MRLPFRDYSMYDKVRNDAAAVQRAIDAALTGTSVTVIASGGRTYASRWVRYEIAKSLSRGNALMVVDVDGVGLDPHPTKGPNPLDYMAARPWSDGRGLDVLEYDGSNWVKFGKLPSVSRADSQYPDRYYQGPTWKLIERFSYRRHWKDVGVTMYFPTAINEAAKAVNK